MVTYMKGRAAFLVTTEQAKLRGIGVEGLFLTVVSLSKRTFTEVYQWYRINISRSAASSTVCLDGGGLSAAIYGTAGYAARGFSR